MTSATLNFFHPIDPRNNCLSTVALDAAKEVYNKKLSALRQAPHYRSTVIVLFVISILLFAFATYDLLDFSGAIGLHSFSALGVLLGALAAAFSIVSAVFSYRYFQENRLKEERNANDRIENEKKAEAESYRQLMTCADSEIPLLLKKNELCCVTDLTAPGKTRIYRSHLLISPLRDQRPYLLCESFNHKAEHPIEDFRYIQSHLQNEDALFYDRVIKPFKFLTPGDLERTRHKSAMISPKRSHVNVNKLDEFLLTDFGKKCSMTTVENFRNLLTQSPEFFKLHYLPGKTLSENFSVFNELIVLAKENNEQEILAFLENLLAASVVVSLSDADIEQLANLAYKENLLCLQEACFYHFAKNQIGALPFVKKLRPPERLDLDWYLYFTNGFLHEKIDFSGISQLSCGNPSSLKFMIENAKKWTHVRALYLKVTDTKNLPQILNFVSECHRLMPSVEIIEILTDKPIGKVESLGSFNPQGYKKLIFVKNGSDGPGLIEEYHIDTEF